MKWKKLFIKTIAVGMCFSFAHVYAIGTAVCPPINAIQCSPDSTGKVNYFSKSTPGDWHEYKALPAPCGSLAKATFLGAQTLYANLRVACSYIIPGSGNGSMGLRTMDFPSYTIGGICHKDVRWNDIRQVFSYGVECQH